MKHISLRKFLLLLIATSIISLTPSFSQAASVSFSWAPNTETNLAGYKIYSGTSPGQYSTSTDVGLPEIIEGVTFSTLSELTEGVTYFFAATAYDSDGFESNFSQEIQWPAPIFTNQNTLYNDFNGDNKADILLRNLDSDQISLYLTDGNNNLDDRLITTLSFVWEIVGLKDFNGDGYTDILLRNSDTGQVWLYQMTGNAMLDSSPIIKLPLEWGIVGLKDFNGDNNTDILWRNINTGEIRLYQMDANSIIKSNTIDTVSSIWEIVRIDDFNGDAKADILFVDYSSGEIWLYQMDGDIIIESSLATTIDLNCEIISPLL